VIKLSETDQLRISSFTALVKGTFYRFAVIFALNIMLLKKMGLKGNLVAILEIACNNVLITFSFATSLPGLASQAITVNSIDSS
jgi:hypothetical protein